jgi:hypothetical protein
LIIRHNKDCVNLVGIASGKPNLLQLISVGTDVLFYPLLGQQGKRKSSNDGFNKNIRVHHRNSED